MQKLTLLKRLLLLLMVFSLVFAAFPALAQDEGEGDVEGDTAAEVVEGEEEAAAEEAVSPLEPLGINPGLLFVQVFNFVLVAIILSAVLWNPARNMLDARAATIAKGLEDASVAASARQNAEQEAEKIRTDARAEVAKTLDESRARGDELAKNIEQEARAEAEKILEEARAEAATARDEELSGLRDQVLNISVAMTRRLIGEALTEKKQKELVSDFFSKIPDDAKSMSGKVQIISAMPLTDSEKKNAEKTLGADEVEYSVDPSILGGLIVRGEDRVVDGSVRSNLNELASNLG